eukprot:7766097-Lingulodinium_polyedra.AAC.2
MERGPRRRCRLGVNRRVVRHERGAAGVLEERRGVCVCLAESSRCVRPPRLSVALTPSREETLMGQEATLPV